MTHLPSQLLTLILQASWHASFLALIVLAFQFLSRKQLPARWRFALWLLVLLRLSGLALPESRLSIFNWIPASPVAMTSHTTNTPDAAPVDPGKPVTLPTPTPMLQARPAPPWLNWAIAIYIAGLATIGTRLTISTLKVRGIVRRATALQNPSVHARLVHARRAIGISRDIPLLTSTEMTSPALIGCLRPSLVLPAKLLDQLSSAEWEFVFLHECAHLKRNDVLINHWLALLSAIHWFNPLTWLLWPRIRADRELACDELVLLATNDAPSYGETLLKIFDGAARSHIACPAAVGIIGTKTFFKRRIHMIAAFRRTPAWLSVPATALLLLIAAASLTSAISVAAVRVDLPGPVGSDAVLKPSPEDLLLEKKIDKIDADGLPFSEMVHFIQDKSEANVVVNWKALENAGIDRNAPISVHVANVPLHKAIRLILSQLENADIDFDIDDNVLTISTREDLSSDTVLRVYNVRDLLQSHDVFAAAPQQPTSQPGPAGLRVTPSAEQVQQQDINNLEQILMSIDPASWTANGGHVGNIVEFHGLLTITTTLDNHAKIEKILATLRAADKQ